MLGEMGFENVGQLLSLLLQLSDLSPQLRVAAVQRLMFLESISTFISFVTDRR